MTGDCGKDALHSLCSAHAEREIEADRREGMGR